MQTILKFWTNSKEMTTCLCK